MTDRCLFDRFTITHVLECMADPSKRRAIVDLADDVSPVFPYLNAVLPKAIFNPKANCVTVKRSGRIITLYPHAATLAKVMDWDDAQQQMCWLQDTCNRTWLQRAEIEPNFQRRKLMDPLDVYELLPQLNCGDCGQATCWAFSFELLFGDGVLDSCPHAAAPEYVEASQRLAELLTNGL